ncbi:hypothetical protein Acr_07g0013110 [Actinidia rufa]|uniref:Transposase (putative) gypsy type domain-containing protein n=1 Tax=Actinidia rufa TaxID=165716 RepID=A0A7J0EXD8_9ERIC|nr:hypothetical protein Acr_07g0013110 [Actinidia rufa]
MGEGAIWRISRNHRRRRGEDLAMGEMEKAAYPEPTGDPYEDTTLGELNKVGAPLFGAPRWNTEYQWKIPEEGEMILSARPSEVAFYEVSFPAGLRFPIHPNIRKILNHYKVYPAQLSPNAWRSVVCSLVIWRYHKRHMSCDEFKCLYSLSSLLDSRWFYSKARPDKNLLRGSSSNVKGWKKSYNKLLALTKNESKRTTEVLEKIDPEGYFKVSKVLDSKTFKKYFACGRMEGSSSGRENTTSGDEGKSHLSRGDLYRGSPSRNDSIEYLGLIRGDIGRIARKAFLDTPNLTLISYVITDQPVHTDQKGWREEGRDQGHELGSDIPTTFEGIGKEAMPPPPPPPKRTKSNRGESNAAVRTLTPGTSTLPGNNLGPRASMMSNAPVAQKILKRLILPADKEKIDQFTTDELVTKSFHALGQVLEAEVAELTSKLALAKKLANEEFKSLDDFKDTVKDSAATYFDEGFEFCKRQLLRHHPNLGVDFVSMEMNMNLAEEEEEAKTGEKEEDNEGEANPTP